jgi:branched-chain amino acid transport system ATP-binding protein
MSLLKINSISKNFGGVQAVTDFSMDVKKGDIASIIGPNGAGKTTIFNLITGVYKIDKGSIVLNDKDISGLEQHERTLKGIGRTFQNIRLFKGLTVEENVLTAFDPLSKYNVFESFFPIPSKLREEKRGREMCREFLEMVGIYHLKDEKPENLPYGYQRKLEIARALACNPSIMLLDEPGAGLNQTEVTELIELIGQLHDKLNMTILLIEHRLEVVMTLSQYIYVQNFGKTLAVGTPKEIQCHPEVIKAYLGG